MDKDRLIEIANTEMPFGKYKGRRLIDVPEEYLLWFARKDQFPAGHLGELMALTLLIKTEGLTSLVEPLSARVRLRRRGFSPAPVTLRPGAYSAAPAPHRP